MKKPLTIIVFVMFPLFSYAEDMSNRFAACGVIENNNERLACYDKIRDDSAAKSQSAQPSSEYEVMELVDLKLDIKSLMGSKVATVGILQVFATDILLLKSSDMDMSPLQINGGDLDRETKKSTLQKCSLGCKVKVEGVVADGELGQVEVKVKHIYFN